MLGTIDYIWSYIIAPKEKEQNSHPASFPYREMPLT